MVLTKDGHNDNVENVENVENIVDEMENLNMNSGDEEEQESDQQILDSTNLYVKGLWKDCSQIQLDDLFHPYGVICQSRVYGNGIGFVRYETPQQAYSALLALNNTKPHERCPQPLVVQFAHKKFYKPKSVLNVGNEQIEMFVRTNTKNVYVRNLPKNNFTEADFTLMCQAYGMINCIRLCNGFGFVRYFDEQSAQNCIHSLHGKFLPYVKFPLVAKLANSDPFEPRIQFRPRDQSQSPQLPPITATVNTNNENSAFPTALHSPGFPLATTMGPISPTMNPMIPQLLNPISNEYFLNSVNNNVGISGYPFLQLDYSFGQWSNVPANVPTNIISNSTTPVPKFSSETSALPSNTESASTNSPFQTESDQISNSISGFDNRMVTTPPIPYFPLNNHINNLMNIGNVPIPVLQSGFSN